MKLKDLLSVTSAMTRIYVKISMHTRPEFEGYCGDFRATLDENLKNDLLERTVTAIDNCYDHAPILSIVLERKGE